MEDTTELSYLRVEKPGYLSSNFQLSLIISISISNFLYLRSLSESWWGGEWHQPPLASSLPGGEQQKGDTFRVVSAERGSEQVLSLLVCLTRSSFNKSLQRWLWWASAQWCPLPVTIADHSLRLDSGLPCLQLVLQSCWLANHICSLFLCRFVRVHY